jgi:hypothetical protein
MRVLRHSRIAIPASYGAIAAAAFRSEGAVAAGRIEKILARELDVPRMIAFAAGRYALHALLSSDALRPGAVLLPAFGCTILLDVVRAAGREPRLVDVAPGRFCLAADDLARKLDEGAAAVIVVHEFGVPADPILFQLCRSKGKAVVIEDLAIAFGARRSGGEQLGREGDAVLLSGGAGKPLSAWSFGALGLRGELADARLIEPRAKRSGRFHAVLLALARFAGTPFGSQLRGMMGGDAAERLEFFDARRIGLAPSRFDLALMRAMIEQKERSFAVRRALGRRLLELFRAGGWRTIDADGDVPLYGRFPVEIPAHLRREVALEAFRRVGIEASVPGRRSVIARAGLRREDFQAAARAEERLIALTIDPGRRDADAMLDRAATALERLGAPRL